MVRGLCRRGQVLRRVTVLSPGGLPTRIYVGGYFNEVIVIFAHSCILNGMATRGEYASSLEKARSKIVYGLRSAGTSLQAFAQSSASG